VGESAIGRFVDKISDFKGAKHLRDAGAVLKIKRTGRPEKRIEIDLANVGSTIDELQAIGEKSREIRRVRLRARAPRSHFQPHHKRESEDSALYFVESALSVF